MSAVIVEYLPILVFAVIAFFVAGAMLASSYIIVPQSPNPEKKAPYECGFPPFDDARSRFQVRFYLVAILFIIFDLEIAFLFPWAVGLKGLGAAAFWSMMVFLAILTVGYVYEWKKGALEWE
ncbi:NADH-quinone oxidoreductase subunit A [Phaeovibrio sulfidiphilus]|uniref:NADH-quinone oxidoreductase subunit A n=1 Tax=Phaeovibrio sulfidiphilus TaxID=1220600 RepID=A0A8J6YYX9_9PROT|nr:NADH-quinone oxidoreductase subunit A [Phaeovibrio sulfidiphilus]MBE1237088.1 NADH-quinone oxidoreductase subunit A [Phaeovibrio sulfidiphilus]